jgi:thioredoxin 1
MNAVNVSQAGFDQEVIQSDKLVIVDFWAEWCGPCKMLAPLLDEVARENPDKVKIVKVNVTDESALANQYNISSIPTLLFFKDGMIREQVTGVMGKKALLEKIAA